MRVLVTGSAGMVGHALMPVLEQEHAAVGLTRKDCDLCDDGAVIEAFQFHKPDAVVHLAAFTNVDGCELDPRKAEACNGLATLNVAKAAREVGATLLYVSTDYVFDGRAATPYAEGARPNPLGVYGKTKLMGERYVQEILERYFIVRTSWVYGPHGKNFVSTVLRLAEENSELRIVNDQRGSPTYTRHLARKLTDLIATCEFGVYHMTAEGNCTWFDFARKIVELSGLREIRVLPISSMECNRPAPRPAFSVLANQRLASLGAGLLPRWEAGLHCYLEELRDGGNCANKIIGERTAYSERA